MSERGSQLVWGDKLNDQRKENANRMAAMLRASKPMPVDGVGLVTAETAGFIEGTAKTPELPPPPVDMATKEKAPAPAGAQEIPVRVIETLQDQADSAQPVPEQPVHLELVQEGPEAEPEFGTNQDTNITDGLDAPSIKREEPAPASDVEAQALMEESEEVLDRLSPAYLNGRAKTIVALKIQYKDDPEAGYRAGAAKFVEAGAEPDPRMQKFSKLLLVADKVSEAQATLAVYERRLSKQEVLGANELADRERKRRLTCSYNQLLGSLVEENEDAMPPERVKRWLEGLASDASEDNWAVKVTLGMQAELIGMKLVQGLAEPDDEGAKLSGITHGDLDQDLRGMDIVFDQTSAGYDSLDVKRQELRGVMPVQHSVATGRMTLYIDPGDIIRNTYELHENAARMYRACLRTVLIEGKVLNKQTIEEMRARYELEPKEAMDEAA